MGLKEKGVTLIELTVVLLILIALAGLAVPYVSGTGSKAMCQATDATLQAVKEAVMGGGAGPGFYGDTLGYFPKATKSYTADYHLKYILTPLTDSSWGKMLTYNPKTALGWRGPYLMTGMTNNYPVDADNDTTDLTDELHSSYGSATYVDSAIVVGDEVVLDGWGRPVILQVPTAGCSTYADPVKCARLVSAGPVPGRNIQSNGFSATLTDGDGVNRDDDRVLFLSIPDPLAGGNVECN